MNYVKQQQHRRAKRIRRVRAKLFGTAQQPRISVNRTNQHISIQAIDDAQGITLASASDLGKETKLKGTKTERAIAAAKEMAAQMKKAKITKACFDRGAYMYHGRVKAVAETLREAGIEV